VSPSISAARGAVYRITQGRQAALVVEYSHPEARVQDNLLCYGLIDAVREVIGPRETG